MIKDIIKKTKAYFCLDCGKCTAVCPIALFDGNFSPRRIVGEAITWEDKVLDDCRIWSCLTCKMCHERCPSDVNFIEFIRLLRTDAREDGKEGVCSHGGAIQSLMKIMTAPNLNQKRLDWITPDLKTSKDSEYLYFVGCLPYFDLFFSNIKANSLDIARSTINILNTLGIEPQVLPNERCCGHDLLWSGDVENFKKLAQHNVAEFNKAGVKKILLSCPEGYACFKTEYPNYLGKFDFEVVHISELLSDKLSSNKMKLKPIKEKVTYQDPCRLGRFSNIYDNPRKIINSIPGIEFVEMERSGKKAMCCGTSSWMNCTQYSKQIQLERLKEAKSTGAETLITFCPKCQIHFLCAQSEVNYPEELKLKIIDLTTFLANALGGE
jgi:heterodisulfide reductase subunit D